jgi:glycosyltransferase involved in cell wall biosynthesis
MSDGPLVSLLMGVHNGERYLREAVDSVLQQALGDLELIVVDDASNDGTGRILGDFDDPRLVVLRNAENVGLTPSLNRALERARGHFVGRQDADDRSLPQRLARQVAFLEARPDVGLCGTWARFIDESGRSAGAGHPPSESDDLADGLLAENKIFHGTILARRPLMEELGGYRNAFRYSQDYDLYLRALATTRLANVPEELYELRFHTASISDSKADLQHRYKALARRLHAQRRETGSDDLHAGVEVGELMESTDVEADFWRQRAMYRRLAGDMPGYRRALREALRRNPRDARAWAHLLLSLSGARGLQAVDHAWRRLTARLRAGRAA